MIAARVLPNMDPAPLDGYFFEDSTGQRMRRITAKEVGRVPHVYRRVWCHNRARYLLPTAELVDWLHDLIGNRQALEICAGMGDLGRQLAIRMTDSAVQVTDPDVMLYYASLRQPPTDPPPDVERIDAVAAVEKYRPRVVIAGWATQLYQAGDEHPPVIASSTYGVDERKILSMVETYVHVGHMAIHRQKRIFDQPHQTFRPSFLFSRGSDPDANVIHVWNQ